jgi:hypothetical protein
MWPPNKLAAGIQRSNSYKMLEGVKVGTSFAKWGSDKNKNLLNGVINVKKIKLEVKK